MATANIAEQVGYCGLYCNACGIRQGKIKNAVENLHNVVAAYGFDKIMSELAKWEPSFQHYNEFEQVMNGLVKLFGYCPGCLQGGGDPNCKVRACIKQKENRTCSECNENDTCEPLAPYREGYEALTTALKTIKQKGIQKYAEEMQKKVDKGYSYLDERK